MVSCVDTNTKNASHMQTHQHVLHIPLRSVHTIRGKSDTITIINKNSIKRGEKISSTYRKFELRTHATESVRKSNRFATAKCAQDINLLSIYMERVVSLKLCDDGGFSIIYRKVCGLKHVVKKHTTSENTKIIRPAQIRECVGNALIL